MKVSIHFQVRRISHGLFICLCSKPQLHLDLADTFSFLMAFAGPAPWTGTQEAVSKTISQEDNLLFPLCMSAELLNFEDSWMKLNVANLHLQIDFVYMGVCTHLSGDKGGIMFDGS